MSKLLKLVKSKQEGLIHQKSVATGGAYEIFLEALYDMELAWAEAIDLDDANDMNEAEKMMVEIESMNDTCVYLWKNYIRTKRDYLKASGVKL